MWLKKFEMGEVHNLRQSSTSILRKVGKGDDDMWKEAVSGDVCGFRVLLLSLSHVYPLNHALWLLMSLVW